MKDVITNNMTIAVILDCLGCCEVEYSWTKTKGSRLSNHSEWWWDGGTEYSGEKKEVEEVRKAC